MGCGRSKPEMGSENLRRKAMEVQRRLRPGRHLSIASSTDLPCSEDANGEYNLVATPSSTAAVIAEEEEGGKKLAAMEALEEADTVEAEEEKGKKLRRAVAEDEQFPGSPSFRFYFAGPTDGSVILQRENIEKSKHSVDGSKHKSQPMSSTKEDLDTKQGKPKAKRKSKLRALAKTPMIHIFNARSYSKVAHARDHHAM
ncbi:uncharacterized protein LOC121978039 [Zingiber officinale]|uniref:uncharacterized protein LOC121978039 n=1 Tax=Zingiber officinale TaxID=94328 RepID=UPI001C4B6869|nr:uncharacterized protein LOC121978039 [Zingiber officinale]